MNNYMANNTQDKSNSWLTPLQAEKYCNSTAIWNQLWYAFLKKQNVWWEKNVSSGAPIFLTSGRGDIFKAIFFRKAFSLSGRLLHYLASSNLSFPKTCLLFPALLLWKNNLEAQPIKSTPCQRNGKVRTGGCLLRQNMGKSWGGGAWTRRKF